MHLCIEEKLEKYQHFIKDWEKILPLSYNDLLKEQEKSNIQVLERKIQDWDGYNPKQAGLNYGLVTKEYKFLKSDIKNKLRYSLINVLDEDNLKCRCEGYKMADIKLFSFVDYNNMINSDINELKEEISKANNLNEERYGAIITNNTKKDMHNGSKSVELLEIPQAKSDDLVVRVYCDNHFYSYEFFIVSDDKIIDVFFYTCD